jgi:hypothetical protein
MRRPTIIENLPLPYVEYPYAFYGAFPGFRETSESPVLFCECQRDAIFNRLNLCCPGVSYHPIYRSSLTLPKTQDFPEAFYQPLLRAGVQTDEALAVALQFRPRICHQCNQRVPCDQLRQSSKKPPGLFRFYHRKIQFEHGVEIFGMILEERSSPQIRNLIPFHPLLYRKVTDSWDNHWKTRQERISVWKQYADAVQKFIGDEFCKAFGFPLRGPTLVNETILYLRTASALSPHKVIRHYRPKDFRGLSLDIFIPDLSVAIEYQGAQHHEAFKHLGGDDELKKTQARDNRKARLCKEAGIHLIYFEGEIAFVSEGEIKYEVMQRVSQQRELKQEPACENGSQHECSSEHLMNGENHRPAKWQRREDLPEDKAAEVNAWEKILNSVSAYRSQHAWALAVSKQHLGERGFSAESLQQLNLRWRRSNQDWRILLRYYSLWRDKGYLLKKHGLTPELVKVWLVEPGIRKSLAQRFGITQTMGSLILNGESVGSGAEKLIRATAKLVFGNKALAQKKLAELLHEQRKLGQEQENLLRQIKNLKKKLETR